MVNSVWALFLLLVPLGLSWAEDGLAARTAVAGLSIGSALEISWATEKELKPLVSSQYGFLTPTRALEWDGDEDWATWVANAQALGLPFRGPRLAGGQTPTRLATLDPKALDREFLARVKTLRSQTAQAPLSWDVASGMFLASGDPAPSPFRKVWGADWPARALSLAKSADPGTPLFLAEDDTLGLNPRSDALYRLVADLKARGAPLDGVALGGRQRLSWRSTGLEVGANLRRFAALGLTIHVFDWDYGLDQDQSIPDRPAVQAQATAYLEVFAWFLATPAVKAVSVAEPSDLFVRTDHPSGVFAAPSLYASAGIPKAVVSALMPALRNRPQATDLVTEAARQNQVPLDPTSGTGLPQAWRTADVWHLVPATEDALPGGEFRHRATLYRNQPEASPNPGPDDFGMYWYLSWTRAGLVFQVERSDDVVLLGNRGESLSVELRGPGFASSEELVVGIDVQRPWFSARWAPDGKFVRVTFQVPAEVGWGPGTIFFFRFTGTDNDGGRDVGLVLDPWPLSPQGTLPWKAFRIVKPYD